MKNFEMDKLEFYLWFKCFNLSKSMKKDLKLTIEVEYSLYQNFEIPNWKFIIGMPINQAIDIISNHTDDYFKKVDFLYSYKVPMHMDIIITLFNEGIKLIFDSKVQRLKMIEIYDLSLVSLYYCNKKFNEIPDLPTKEKIINIFGYTKTPDYDNNKKCYLLSYRTGLSFSLSSINHNINPNQQCIYPSGNINPLVATAAFIYDGHSMNDADIPKEIPLECFLGNILLEELVINREDYRTSSFDFFLVLTENSANVVNSSNLQAINSNRDDKLVKIKRSIKFGDSVQYVITALGAPNRIYFKTEDKMKIHSSKSQKEKLESKMQNRNSDYFYNYLTLGVDIMFRFEDNCVSKLILHTNFPDEYLFNTYYRCFFSLSLDRDVNSVDNIIIPDLDNIASKFQVATLTKWSQIQPHILVRADPVPVEISRFIDQCHKSGVCSETMAYGVDDLIFEIMPENDHIASLTIYEIDDNVLES